jgi:hypothetical protein
LTKTNTQIDVTISPLFKERNLAQDLVQWLVFGISGVEAFGSATPLLEKVPTYS